MTIEKGRSWGHPATLPPGAPVAASDRHLAALAAEALAADDRLVAGLEDGDLLRTLGLSGARRPEDRLAFPIDLGFVSLDDGDELPFVAHVIARRARWRGSFAVVMNAAWFGGMYLGPRAHPNDGLLDVTVGAMSAGQRVLARKRVKTGSHLPHPDLSTVRRGWWEHRFKAPVPVFVDGHPAGRSASLSARIVADCFTIIV